MTAPRLSEVAARVVAWHNRHPLARRIDASQVHSIGEVRLPFASDKAWGHTPPASPADAPAAAAPPADQGHAPSLAEALAQRHARHAPPQASGIDGLDVASVLPEPEPAPQAAASDEPPPEADAAAVVPTQGDANDGNDGNDANNDDDDGEAALVIPLLDGDEAAATPDAVADTSADAPPAAAQSAPDADAPESPEDIDLDFGEPAPPAAPPTAPPTSPPTDPTSPADDSPATAEDLPDAATDTAVAEDNEALIAAAAEVAAEFPDVYPPPHGNVPASALARAVERRAAARSAAPHDADIPAAAPVAVAAAAGGPLAPAATSRWRRLIDAARTLFTGRQRGLPPLRAAFSDDFAWPLRPGAVARWAQRHGRPEPLAPPDWPHRSVDTDRARLARHRGKGFAHDLPLHVLTAAIGVGDRRIRVLIGADGSILGPRAFDRSRSGAAAMLAAVGLVALGWTLRPLQAPPADPAVLLAVAPAAAASAPAAPALAASAPAEAASAATVADPSASAAHAEPAEAHAANAASAPEAAASGPPGDIRPMLTEEAKYTAKVEAAALRGEPPPAPPEPAGPVYAVVSPGSDSPEGANRSLTLMRAAADRLDGGAPAHGELINSQGQWRAAWWPFASLVDAERARVLLAGRGVKAEVIEF